MNFFRSAYVSLLSGYLRKYRKSMFLLAFLFLSNIVLQIANPLLLRTFIDGAQSKAPLSFLLEIVLFFMIATITAQAIGVCEAYVSNDIAWKATNTLREDVTLHCLYLDMPFHHVHTPGEMVERIDGDIGLLNDFFSRFVLTLATNFFFLIGTLIVLWVIDWRIGFALSLYSLLTLGLIIFLRRFGKTPWNAARQSSADMIGFLEERLAATEDIRALAATSYLLSRLQPLLRKRLTTERRATTTTMTLFGITTIVFSGATALALGLSGSFFREGVLSLGTVYVIFNYALQLSQPLNQVSNNMNYFQKASASIQRLQDLLSIEPAMKNGLGMELAAPEAEAFSVDFEHVSFGYTEQEPILHDITFSVKSRQLLGIVGRTGSGKTTLSRLLFRLYDPQQGTVRLSGKDIRTQRLMSVRSNIGLVTQEVQLFDTTLRNNVTLFDPTIADTTIIDAFQELGIDRWYQRLPQGLDTPLTAGGSMLSAGEAQLITLARLFLKRPRLIIMDEATSRIDPATEEMLEQAMNRLFQNCTGIIIAHRLSTIQRVHTLLMLENGRIVEQGLRTDLLQNPDSRFSHLLRTGQMEVLA